MEGYVLLKRGKGGSGECGILSQASYPVVHGSPSPGPSPGPSPPPSPPSPSTSHYEKPPCQSDETEAQDQSGNQYCALKCGRSAGQCPPEATCAKVGFLVSICVYPVTNARLHRSVASETSQFVV